MKKMLVVLVGMILTGCGTVAPVYTYTEASIPGKMIATDTSGKVLKQAKPTKIKAGGGTVTVESDETVVVNIQASADTCRAVVIIGSDTEYYNCK